MLQPRFAKHAPEYKNKRHSPATVVKSILIEVKKDGKPLHRKGAKGAKKIMAEEKDKIDLLSKKIIGAAIDVHKALGPGLLESAYEECLCCELGLTGIEFKRQVALPVTYKTTKLDCGYRLDIVEEKVIILELKAIERILPIHEAQLLAYLKLSDIRLGILLNFNVPFMRNGIRRIVHGF